MTVQEITWVQVGRLDDLPKQGARKVVWAGTKIAIFRTGADRVFAIEDRCPHKNGPLSEGIVHDNCVTCPLHNWVISLETGKAQGADSGETRTYPVRVEGDVVLLGL